MFFFFNDTATTEIYTLSLHDALPISAPLTAAGRWESAPPGREGPEEKRSEEHTSELQSRLHLVCRLLLEKKNIITSFVSDQPINWLALTETFGYSNSQIPHDIFVAPS